MIFSSCLPENVRVHNIFTHAFGMNVPLNPFYTAFRTKARGFDEKYESFDIAHEKQPLQKRTFYVHLLFIAFIWSNNYNRSWILLWEARRMAEYMTVQETARLWVISERRVQKLCPENRIEGVIDTDKNDVTEQGESA